MAETNLDLSNPGGRLDLGQPGVLFGYQDVDAIGNAAIRSLFQWLRVVYYDERASQPQSGVFGSYQPEQGAVVDTINDDDDDYPHFFVRKDTGGDLDIFVEAGYGLVFDSSATPDDFEIEEYRPVVLDAQAGLSAAAHEANPRIDLVIAEPAFANDVPTARNVRNPTTQAVTTPTIDLRRKYSATVSIVKGTAAASPSPPAVPAGAVPLAELHVPASTGALTITDRRLYLTPTSGQVKPANHVVRGCDPTIDSPATIDVAPGVLSFAGAQRWFAGGSETVTLTGGSGRVETFIITAAIDGTLSSAVDDQGVGGTTRTVPSAADNLVIVAFGVAVSGSITSVTGWAGGPVGANGLAPLAVNSRHIADDAITNRHLGLSAVLRYRSIPGSSFVVDDGQAVSVLEGRLTPEDGTTAYKLYAEIDVDHLAVLTTFIAYFGSVSIAAVSVTVNILEIDLATGVATLLGTATANVPNGGGTLLGSCSVTVNRQTKAYVAEIEFTSPTTASNLTLNGLTITYSSAQPIS